MRFINLKKFREDNGLTQKELVRMTGLSQSTVSYMENRLQEICEKHLSTLKEVFPSTDFSQYIYESKSYARAVVNRDNDEEAHRNFEGDWSTPSPIERIGSSEILLSMGRVSVTKDGYMLLDRNDGTFNSLGYYEIDPEGLMDSHIIDHLVSKAWFNDEIYEDFKRCYLIACRLAGREPTVQIKRVCSP